MERQRGPAAPDLRGNVDRRPCRNADGQDAAGKGRHHQKRHEIGPAQPQTRRRQQLRIAAAEQTKRKKHKPRGEETEVAIVESMKMEIPVEAGIAGTVAEVLVTPGDKVAEGQTIAVLS